MSLIDPKRPNAPIPGENYTSDTRNYPWHRPPDITDLDEAMRFIVRDLTETDSDLRYMAMIEVGVTVASVTDMIVTINVGRGKFTPDFALLLAGPVARLLTVMAKQYDIEYDLGIDDEAPEITAPYLRMFQASEPEREEADDAVRGEAELILAEETEGLMAPAPEEEQRAMLGYGAGDEDVQEEEVV